MADFKLLTFGAPMTPFVSSNTLGTFSIDATTDQLEWIFQVPTDNANATISITRLGYRLASVTGAQPVYIISLQGVTGAGIPDGTIKGGGTPASGTFTPSGSATWNWVTLDNAYTAARGEFLAIVIGYSSGTIGGSNLATFNHMLTGSSATGLPYTIQNNAGTRTNQSSWPIYGYGSATQAYGFPIQALASNAVSSNSSPDEYALNFTLPTTYVSTYKVVGARWVGTLAATAKSTKMVLYDGNGTTVLQDMTWDSDISSGVGTARPWTLYFDEATLATLNAGTAYRISLQPQDVSMGNGLMRFQFAAAADMEALPGGGAFFFSSQTNVGGWVDAPTERMFVELIIQDWTAPSGGGGPVGHGRLSGGLQ